MRKIWQEDAISGLPSFRNINCQHIRYEAEIIDFVNANESVLSEWVLDKWVDDRNMGRVQLWEGSWTVIPMPLNPVGTTANDEDYQLSEMVSFVKLFNTTVERVQEVLPKLTDNMKKYCPVFYQSIKDDIDSQLLKSGTISKLSPGTKINPHSGDIDSLRLHIPIVDDSGAWLSVRGRKRSWKVGELFAFHDHDKHWAQHNGDHDRIVVILDYSLSQLEKSGISIQKWEEELAI